MAHSGDPPAAHSYTADKTDWMYAIAIAIGAGVAVVAILGVTNAAFGRIEAVMSGLMLAGASGLVGAFLGFLFGIPRSKQAQAQLALEEGRSAREYLENTNLEQISDWLTKIIVGLTLVQFEQIKGFVVGVGAVFGKVFVATPATTTADTAGAIAVAVILYFVIAGFLFAFLWTRIHMENVLRQQSAEGDIAIERLLERRQEQENIANAKAFELTDAYLDPAADPNAKMFDNLEEKVKESSLIARTMIFDRARTVRQKNWRDGGNKKLIDRTIPIFRGLIAAAPDRQHRNYGQLGYALVKASQPNWSEAQAALEKAIRLRGDDDSGQGYYELNLAVALINQDPDFLAGKASTAATRERVAGLLDRAGEVVDLNGEPAIKSWAALNDYRIKPPR